MNDAESKNEEWIEAAWETLESALADDDIALAKNVIADTIDNGFGDEARLMNRRLREATNKGV